MPRCINACGERAEQNFTWPTSRGAVSVNICGVCASGWWAKFKNTPCGQGLIIGPVKSRKELADVCKEYSDAV